MTRHRPEWRGKRPAKGTKTTKIAYLEVLTAYPADCKALRAEFLGAAGGFSGAEIWRIHAPAGALCLRKWPLEHPSGEVLETIHALLRHVSANGFPYVPVPRLTRDGRTYVVYDRHLWELTPWMSGSADFHQSPSVTRLRTAMTALAEFHRAAKSFGGYERQRGPSPGIEQRLAQLRNWLAGGLEVLRSAVRPEVRPELEGRTRRILRLAPRFAGGTLALLEACRSLTIPLQFCIGDVWRDHLLLQGDTVVGLIDFGSVRVDNVSADVARLLGSLAGDDKPWWQAGMESYQACRPLEESELLLVKAFDRSTVLMSGLNWIDWIYCQGRTFASGDAIPRRLDEILLRLENMGIHG
jgi:Ser/Thr protein kinase RdoA (MazF antagonist)